MFNCIFQCGGMTVLIYKDLRNDSAWWIEAPDIATASLHLTFPCSVVDDQQGRGPQS